MEGDEIQARVAKLKPPFKAPATAITISASPPLLIVSSKQVLQDKILSKRKLWGKKRISLVLRKKNHFGFPFILCHFFAFSWVLVFLFNFNMFFTFLWVGVKFERWFWPGILIGRVSHLIFLLMENLFVCQLSIFFLPREFLR